MIDEEVAIDRLVSVARRLQKLMREKIDPEGSMTDKEFLDKVLIEIDDEQFNEAMRRLGQSQH